MPAPRAILLFLAGLLVLGAAPAQALTSQDASAYPTLDRDPVGANDWTCAPTVERPYPAVIVHGTFGDRASLLDGLSAALKSDGYCVFALDYGDRGTGPVEESAAELRDYVDRVLAETGADRVELVGHSQGGMMPRYYIKYLGGDGLVEDLVGLAPSNHGTEVSGAFGSGSTRGCFGCHVMCGEPLFDEQCARRIVAAHILRTLNFSRNFRAEFFAHSSQNQFGVKIDRMLIHLFNDLGERRAFN
jgi:triacylglycerol esterase/lipase EstA (alpha/beta hydrolase family)